MKTIPIMTVCLLLLLLPLAASAVKLYKWVDKDGHVTYQETPPPADAGKVEEKDINPDTNVIHADQPAPSATSSRQRNTSTGEQESDGRADTGAKATTPPVVLQEGDQPDVPQAPNPLPARTPPPIPAAPAAQAPPPVVQPPPPLPPPPALPPPPPGGAH